MLVHRLRRWPNINPTLGQGFVVAGSRWAICLHQSAGGLFFSQANSFLNPAMYPSRKSGLTPAELKFKIFVNTFCEAIL